jgi:hypothetical protein
LLVYYKPVDNIHTAHQEESLDVRQVMVIIFDFPQSLCLMEKILPSREYVLGGGKNIRAIRIGLSGLANGFAMGYICEIHTLAIDNRLLTRRGVQNSDLRSPSFICCRKMRWSRNCVHGWSQVK